MPKQSIVPGPNGSASGDVATGLVDRLQGLLAEWRHLAEEGTLQHRLGDLLGKLAPLLRRRSDVPLDAERLASMLPALSSALAQRRQSGNAMNPWTIAGAKRREVRNAAILAALWSPAQVGDIAAAFLGGFFDLCAATSPATLPDHEELARGYRVRVENCPGIDGADRVDLIIETWRHLIGIEIKIDAGEGREQLKRYVDAIGRSARQLGRLPRIILLAPFAPSREDVVAADWSMVRAAATAALPRRRSDHDFAHHLIAAFARHIRSF